MKSAIELAANGESFSRFKQSLISRNTKQFSHLEICRRAMVATSPNQKILSVSHCIADQGMY